MSGALKGAPRRVAVGLLAALCLFPVAYLVLLSIASSWLSQAPWPEALDVKRWMRAWGADDPIFESLRISVLVSAMVAGLSTGLGYVTGRFVAYHRHRRGLLLLAYVPFMMSPVVIGVCLMYVYLRIGLAGTVPGVVLAQSMFSFGFAIIFFTAFWNERMRAFEELARTLGSTRWAAYRAVLIPLSLGPLAACLFQTYLISWFQYGVTLLVGAGQVRTLPLVVYAYVGEANVAQAALAAVFLVVPPLTLLLVRRVLVGATS